MAERAQRYIHQPRADRRELVRRQAARTQRTRAITLREHICRAHQPAQYVDVTRFAQVELSRQFAVPRVELLVTEVRQMLPRDLQNICAVLGQRASERRTREHASEVE